MTEKLDIDAWMVEWNRDTGDVEVVAHPAEFQRRAGYYSAGCCFRWKHRTRAQKMDQIIRGFMFLVLGEGIDPQAVHREFSKIKGYLEYRGELGLGLGNYVWFQRGRMDPYNP